MVMPHPHILHIPSDKLAVNRVCQGKRQSLLVMKQLGHVAIHKAPVCIIIYILYTVVIIQELYNVYKV